MLFLFGIFFIGALIAYYLMLLMDIDFSSSYHPAFESKREFRLAWIPFYRWFSRIRKFYNNLPD